MRSRQERGGTPASPAATARGDSRTASGAPAGGEQSRRLAVLGHPIGHSLSPVLHNAAFRAVGLPWTYERRDVPPAELPAALAALRADPTWAGVNLTIPHKEAALALLDRVDPAARRVGAVNTVVREDGGILVGYNTDGIGFLRDLEEHGLPPSRLAGHRALVLGAGGAARAVAFALAEAGMTLVIANRTVRRAEELAAAVAAARAAGSLRGGPSGPTGPAGATRPGGPEPPGDPAAAAGRGVTAGEAGGGRVPPVLAVSADDPRLPGLARGCLLVVNATSAGMAPQEGVDPLPPACRPHPGQVFYDLVYRPAVTPFLARAAAAGARAIGGLGMLLHQGAAAFELWTNRPAPVEAMRAALQAALEEAVGAVGAVRDGEPGAAPGQRLVEERDRH